MARCRTASLRLVSSIFNQFENVVITEPRLETVSSEPLPLLALIVTTSVKEQLSTLELAPSVVNTRVNPSSIQPSLLAVAPAPKSRAIHDTAPFDLPEPGSAVPSFFPAKQLFGASLNPHQIKLVSDFTVLYLIAFLNF
jgi:hypothetical protein